jgi:hypothetical protein
MAVEAGRAGAGFAAGAAGFAAGAAGIAGAAGGVAALAAGAAGAAGAAVAADGATGAAAGTRIEGPPAGFGGRLIRTVCFFWDASAGLGGSEAAGGFTGGVFSDIGILGRR